MLPKLIHPHNLQIILPKSLRWLNILACPWLRLAASSIKIVTCSWTCPAGIVPGCVLHEYRQLFADASFMNIANCSRMCPSWISPIVPRCVLHEYRQLFPDASFMNIVNCSQMCPLWWVLHEYCQLFVNALASGILPGPAPCTLHPGCVLHQSLYQMRRHPAFYMKVSLGASMFFILQQFLAAWMDASCIDTAVPDSNCLADSLFCMWRSSIFPCSLRQGNCWECYTENTINTLSHRPYSNCTYPWYVPT